MQHDFTKLSKAVQIKFNSMQQNRLFKVDVDSDLLYQTYLEAFPEGTNEIFRERTEHDCACCRQFIKNIGKVVSIENDKIITVWDVKCDEYPYDIVAQKMSEFVSKQRIHNVYKSKFPKYGTEFNLELLEDNTTRRWDHFVGILDSKHGCNNPSEIMSAFQSDFQVLKRGLDELSMDSIDTVADLISDNLLYRGQEHQSSITSFRKLKQQYDAYTKNDKDLFIWNNIDNRGRCRFRNTVIGTLVTDLSDGVDLQKAVKKFESKVAPANYKRPSALITPRMISDAMKTIKELDLERALERRYARFSDVNINDVLFVDNSVKDELIGGLETDLLSTVKTKPVKVKNTIDITIDEFINSVLPKAHDMEALVKNKDLKNLVSLTAPINENVENLFKWDNNFAWSYDGNVADSDIKARVKQAGGDVNALLRCSLAWFNSDDLDIHVKQPNGSKIYFGSKQDILDIDMNAGGRHSRTPVENTRWNKNNLKDGKYVVSVNNYTKRESIDVGFTLEVEFGGIITTFHYKKAVGDSATIQSLELIVKDKVLVDIKTIDKNIVSEESSKEQWGINTETFVPVSSVILSPNHWSENHTGNKHWFFMLKDCKNPDKIRGIYNEFLKGDLDKHRKVFEIVGDKTKCEYSDDQMSGIGFSSTKKESLTLKVKSDIIQQVYNINF